MAEKAPKCYNRKEWEKQGKVPTPGKKKSASKPVENKTEKKSAE